MATTINAGRVRFVSRGTYNNSTQYYLFDLVDYNGSSYIAKENTLGNLPTNTQYWQLIAEKGNTGSTGQTGPVGPTGNGISSITKTGTSGLVDTYTITYTNGNTTTFTVTNGEDGEVTETELDVLRKKVANQQKVIDQLPQVTGQGTEVTLQDTIEAPFTKFDVEGNSVQETTEGRQLLDFSNPSRGSSSSFNNDVFITNGTGAYANTIFDITELYKNNTGKTLRFDCSSIDYSNTGDNNVLVMLYVNNGQDNYYGLLSKNTRITHTIPSDVSNVTTAQVRFCSNNTSDTSNHSLKITKPILHFGADEQDYEKFTGRQASPNPNYEQPVKSAGENVNLLPQPYSYGTVTTNGITKTENADGSITLKGTATSDTGFYLYSTASQFVTKAGTHTFSIKSSKVKARIIYDGRAEPYIAGNNKKTTTLNSDVQKTQVNLLVESGVNVDETIYLKLEQGTVATPYSPYGMGSINEKILTSNIINIIRTLGTPSNTGYDNTNKRTFDVTTLIKFLTANNYYNAGVQIDYSLIDKGIKITTKQAGYGIGFPVILSPAKTYTISANIDVIDNQMIRAIFYKEDGTYISNVTSSGTNKFLTFTTTDDTYFVVVMLTPKANVETTYSNIMLNEGNTALPYVEHKEQDYPIFVQQPMRSIGDVRDLFFKNVKGSKYYNKDLEENKWYERHYKRLIFDGTENWQFSTGSGVAGIYMLNPPIDDMVQGNFLDGLSNYFHNDKSGKGKNSIRFGANNNVIYIYVDSNEFPDKTSFTSWLAEKYASGHPLYIDYISAEPLDLPCTETQIQQLENIPSTYKDFTIIQSEDETPAYLEVAGIYDLNKLITRTEVLESES